VLGVLEHEDVLILFGADSVVVNHGVEIGVCLGAGLVVLLASVLLALGEALVEEAKRVLGPSDTCSEGVSQEGDSTESENFAPVNLRKRKTSVSSLPSSLPTVWSGL
jgi:hypothetical protein